MSSVLSSGSRNSVGLVLFLALFTNIGRELTLSNICEKREKKKADLYSNQYGSPPLSIDF